MSNTQAPLHLCNLAGIYGLEKAREMLGMTAPEEKSAEPVTPPAGEGSETSSGSVNPPDFVPPAANVAAQSAEDPAKAQRAAEDEGAKNATAAQLKAALTQLGIEFRPTAKKADLLALFLARP